MWHLKRMILTSSAREFKNVAWNYIPPIKLAAEKQYKVSVEYHGKFLNKDGTTKNRDGQNLDKCLYDIIFEKLSGNDKQVWEGYWKKINDEQVYTLVTIEEINGRI